MAKKISKLLYWTPRIMSVVFILFLALFSLDVFGEGLSLWEAVIALIIHNIPVLILIILLGIAWKYEIVGAIAFVLAGIAYIILVSTSSTFEWYMISWSIIIAGPAFFIGILFWMNWYKKKNKYF